MGRSSASADRWSRSAAIELLETIAANIAEAVLDVPGVLGVTVRVRKLAVPIDADLDFAQVEIHRP